MSEPASSRHVLVTAVVHTARRWAHQLVCALLLAQHHIHNRSPAVVRALPRALPPNFSLALALFDNHDRTPGHDAAFRIYRESRRLGSHAYLGPARSSVATMLGYLANIDAFPMLSYWASSPALSDVSIYRFFARTYLDDSAIAGAYPRLLAAFDWRACSVFHFDDAYAVAYSQALVAALDAMDLAVAALAQYNSYDRTTLDPALRIVKESQVTVIVALVEEFAAAEVFGAAASRSLLTNASAWITTDTFSREAPAAAAALMRGMLGFVPSATHTAGFGRFAEALEASSPAACGNPLFDPASVHGIFERPVAEVAAYAYDALITLAMALAAVDDPANGSQVMAAIRATRFDGATGAVDFDSNGDRGGEGFTYELLNWQAGVGGGVSAERVASLAGAGGELNVSGRIVWIGGGLTPPVDTYQRCDMAVVAGECTDDSGRELSFEWVQEEGCYAPPEEVLPPLSLVACSYVPVGSRLATALIVVGSVLVAALAAAEVWVQVYVVRKQRQLPRTLMKEPAAASVGVLCGAALAALSPTYMAGENERGACVAREILLGVSFILMCFSIALSCSFTALRFGEDISPGALPKMIRKTLREMQEKISRHSRAKPSRRRSSTAGRLPGRLGLLHLPAAHFWGRSSSSNSMQFGMGGRPSGLQQAAASPYVPLVMKGCLLGFLISTVTYAMLVGFIVEAEGQAGVVDLQGNIRSSTYIYWELACAKTAQVQVVLIALLLPCALGGGLLVYWLTRAARGFNSLPHFAIASAFALAVPAVTAPILTLSADVQLIYAIRCTEGMLVAVVGVGCDLCAVMGGVRFAQRQQRKRVEQQALQKESHDLELAFAELDMGFRELSRQSASAMPPSDPATSPRSSFDRTMHSESSTQPRQVLTSSNAASLAEVIASIRESVRSSIRPTDIPTKKPAAVAAATTAAAAATTAAATATAATAATAVTATAAAAAAAETFDLPIPEALQAAGGTEGRRPGDLIRMLMANVQQLDKPAFLQQVTRAASRLRDASYSLFAFHNDMQLCFPELRLYIGGAAGDRGSTTGGRTREDEYRRTIGALFAVYWLCRLELPEVPDSAGLGGQVGFCFGVEGALWLAPSPDRIAASRPPTLALPHQLTTEQKRARFLESVEWGTLHKLMCDAGVLQPNEDGSCSVNTPRAVAMIVLTAIHDIMKLEEILPTVLPQHAPYKGHGAGEQLYDHDDALSYVLELDPDALGCFAALSAEQRKPIVFTQGKMGFNHGWLVQAEAPPGALLSTFKRTIQEESVTNEDIAFYFAHWLTDLAGAEATPLSGCEKFVIKFPQTVLSCFIRSFSLVQQLADQTETELMENFLTSWWPRGSLGDEPRGPDAIAKMRLVIQAQSLPEQIAILDAFDNLDLQDRNLLSLELALTGLAGQTYSLTADVDGGPAFLIYYSPTFLRHCAQEDAYVALRVLVDVYRAARSLWPLSHGPEEQGTCVTVHIGHIKGLPPGGLSSVYGEGQCWVLRRLSERDAVVERHSLLELQSLYARCECAVLPLWMSHLQARSPPGARAFSKCSAVV